MLYSWDRLNKIGPIKNNRLSVQIDSFQHYTLSAAKYQKIIEYWPRKITAGFAAYA